MCGIVGVIGQQPAAPLIVDALRRLEYRGYDSAGVATLVNGHIDRRRAEGKLGNLKAALDRRPLRGTTGIGHTRWATHGAPTENNAHPHGNCACQSCTTASSRTMPSCARNWRPLGRSSAPRLIPKRRRSSSICTCNAAWRRPRRRARRSVGWKVLQAHGGTFAGHPELMIGAQAWRAARGGFWRGRCFPPLRRAGRWRR